MAVISVSSSKGGVGKTTTSVNLAAALAKLENDVLVIDLDPQASATIHLGQRPRELGTTIGDCLRGTRGFPSILYEVSPYLSLAPANAKLSQVGQALSLLEEGYTQLSIRMDIENYDYVIIDTPPSFDTLTQNGVFASDYFLIPVQADYLSLEGLSSVWQEIDEFKASSSAHIGLLGILVNSLDHRLLQSTNTIASEAIQLLRKEFGGAVFEATIRETVRVMEAPSHGMSVLAYAPDSPASDEYMKLAKEVQRKCQTS